MSNFPILKKAPIKEAIIEFRYPSIKGLSFEELEKISSPLTKKYPNKKTGYEQQIEFEITEGKGKSKVKDRIPKSVILSLPNKNNVHLENGRFLFSKMGPYDKWELFSEEAIEAWSLVNENLNVKEFTRMGVRFINNLNLPKGEDCLKDHLQSPPKVSEEICDISIEGFLTRLVLVNTKYNDIKAYVTLGLDHNKNPMEDTLPVILDIDVIKSGKINLDLNTVIENLSNLRNFKNELFFKSLTPVGLELYK